MIMRWDADSDIIIFFAIFVILINLISNKKTQLHLNRTLEIMLHIMFRNKNKRYCYLLIDLKKRRKTEEEQIFLLKKYNSNI